MNKEKIIEYLESGISLESVVLELVSEQDKEFQDQVKKLLEIQTFQDKKKDLDLKFHVLTEKINMLDHYIKQGHNTEYYLHLANKYWITVQRMQKAINKLSK